MNNLGIALKYNYTNNDYFKISPGKIPLIDIFKDEYRKYIKSFKNKELLYLEQFLYIGSKALREWNEMSRIYRGKIPIWWHQLKVMYIWTGPMICNPPIFTWILKIR